MITFGFVCLRMYFVEKKIWLEKVSKGASERWYALDSKRKLCSNLRQGSKDTLLQRSYVVIWGREGSTQGHALCSVKWESVKYEHWHRKETDRLQYVSSNCNVCVRILLFAAPTTTGGKGGETPPTSSGITGTCWPTASCKISLSQHALWRGNGNLFFSLSQFM
jgi:hypothetical protein